MKEESKAKESLINRDVLCNNFLESESDWFIAEEDLQYYTSGEKSHFTLNESFHQESFHQVFFS